jgi:uncharacterized integral membrane protein
VRRFLIVIILLPVTIAAIVLSVANREPVTFSLDPFGATSPQWSLTAPLFVLLFAALAIGVLAGGVATWMRQRKWRHAARSERANAQRLRQEVERLRQRATTPAIAGPSAERDAA